MIDIDDPVIEVQVVDRQTAKLGDSQTSPQQQKNCVIIRTITLGVENILQQLFFLFFGQCGSFFGIIMEYRL